LGERLAAAHLEAKGYRVVDRNYRRREGEVDVVAERGGALVFVEVRTRMGGEPGEAAESITPAKAARLLAVAEVYCQEHPGGLADCRIDVVTVELSPDGRLRKIAHIENAVEG
jgi:putative endonuclease